MKKIKPILFSTEMLQAILAERKTQTRRVVTPQPIKVWMNTPFKATGKTAGRSISCPYGQVGNVLWVRETITYDASVIDGAQDVIIYKSDCPNYTLHSGQRWKPSIFMPKSAARIFLEITNIRVERLNDISEEDAIKEGVIKIFNSLFNEWRFKDYANIKSDWRSAVSSFQSLWASINGIGSWDKNPYVWVIEFKQVEKPLNF